jgi:hypothetical protein
LPDVDDGVDAFIRVIAGDKACTDCKTGCTSHNVFISSPFGNRHSIAFDLDRRTGFLGVNYLNVVGAAAWRCLGFNRPFTLCELGIVDQAGGLSSILVSGAQLAGVIERLDGEASDNTLGCVPCIRRR